MYKKSFLMLRGAFFKLHINLGKALLVLWLYFFFLPEECSIETVVGGCCCNKGVEYVTRRAITTRVVILDDGSQERKIFTRVADWV